MATPPEDKMVEAAQAKAKEDKAKEGVPPGGGKKEEKELSAEDQALLEGLELAVERARDPDLDVQAAAIEHLVKEVRTATSSMTSVPKPLKFLRPYFNSLKELHAEGVKREGTKAAENMRLLADLLAVLAITMAKPGSGDILGYKKKGNLSDLRTWGSEFVRSLAGEIGTEYNRRQLEAPKEEVDRMEVEEERSADLMVLVDEIVPFHLKHNAEPEAIDLLLEVSKLPKLVAYAEKRAGDDKALIDEANYARICLYLLRCAGYMAEPDDLRELLSVAYDIYLGQRKYPEALRVALQLDDAAKVGALFAAEGCEALTKTQMAFILARHGSNFEVPDDDDDDKLNQVIGNNRLTAYYQELARDLDVVEPKSPEDIYRSHLGDSIGNAFARRQRDAPGGVDSARANLASTFVNAFVNAGFGNDTLMTPEGNEWLYKNKEHGMLSAAASLGMIMMWNVEEGLTQIDKFLYSTDDHVKAGACLAIGVVSSGVRNDADPPIALLPEHLEPSATPLTRTAAIVALGIAYAGSAREDVYEYLTPLVSADPPARPTFQTTAEVALSALSLGQVFVGTCNEDVGSLIVERLMEASDAELDFSISRFLGLGLALLFLGKMDKADAILEALKTIDHPIGAITAVALETAAYAGTGNVLVVQKMLHMCAEHHTNKAAKDTPAAANEATGAPKGANAAAAAAATSSSGPPPPSTSSSSSEEAAAAAAPPPPPPPPEGEATTTARDDSHHQSVAVLGIAVVTAGDDIGAEMALRTYDHLLHYGDLAVRRAVPLALALLKVSNPEYAVVDQLSRLTHDAETDVAHAAILGLGLVGAGTNHSRIAGLLRQLAEHSRDAAQLFVVRLAQGLLHMGKGLLSISPFHSDRQLMNPAAMGSLLIFLHLALDLEATVLDKFHFMLYYLASAMHPRMLMTVDEHLELVPASVRVGKAVETVGQAGKPKTITGFQTHTTPVLLGVDERAELTNPELLTPLTSTLESIVILVPGPEADNNSNNNNKDSTETAQP